MHIVIVGNGISGITAARFIRKLSNHQITVISSETEYFFSRTALMYVYMGHMRFEDIQPYEHWFWKKNCIDLVQAHVNRIDTNQKCLLLDGSRRITYDKLILATGSVTAKYNWPGQDLKGVQGLYTYQDLQTMESASKGLKHAVIVGGGLIGIEMAEMFHSRGIEVTMLVRERNYCEGFLPKEEAMMVNREITRYGITLKIETELSEILGDEDGNAIAVVTNHGERISCGFVGITTGVTPNIKVIDGSGISSNNGILVDAYLQTHVKDIYAIGDCAEVQFPQQGRKSIEPLWYCGRIMGETVAYNVCGNQIPYEPGIWFNSAKFFTIEYQVYGTINPIPGDDFETVYWEHHDGRKSIRIQFRKSDYAVVGFNLMGIRYRQEICEKWIGSSATINEVLPQLSLANFDAEFSKQFEKEVLEAYNRRFGGEIQLHSKRGLSPSLAK